MHILLLTDTYYPDKNSAAIQLRHLAEALVQLGHEITIICPNVESKLNSQPDGLVIIGTRYFRSKSKSLALRFLLELILSLIAIYKFHVSNIKNIDGVIYYSPTIFWSLAVFYFRFRYKCKSYLIVRDIFPDWAYSLNIIKNAYIYKILKFFAKYQYSAATKIGVQTPSSIKYLEKEYSIDVQKLEVLENWLGDNDICEGPKELMNLCSSKRVLIYAGNVGRAQNLKLIVDAVSMIKDRDDFLFLIMGSGDEISPLKALKQKLNITNLIIHDYIPEAELQAVLQVCDVGLVSLHTDLIIDNIPGKFVNYIKNNLAVLACVNPGNDIVSLIDSFNIGVAYTGDQPIELRSKIFELCEAEETLHQMQKNAKELYESRYSTSRTARILDDYFLTH